MVGIEDDVLLPFAITLAAYILLKKGEKRQEKEEQRKRPRKEKGYWVRSWLARRKLFGQWERLVHEIPREDRSSFKNFLRVDQELFTQIY
ncbi:hypothetical protein Pcinc_000017 [Petrolisthes cinctipes]|uniref:Uncharacterized protein n=1 Tax=Petrolisthes cinctipes TaxID=88211 RepID=A0AAE1L545_PETCI|nr:hypothetical protein Pcinc_000017 [Petrolisthes cinctipes]